MSHPIYCTARLSNHIGYGHTLYVALTHRQIAGGSDDDMVDAFIDNGNGEVRLVWGVLVGDLVDVQEERP